MKLLQFTTQHYRIYEHLDVRDNFHEIRKAFYTSFNLLHGIQWDLSEETWLIYRENTYL